MTIIHEDAADKYSVVATVPTKKTARTITVDEQTHLVYLPAAETEPTTGGGRPRAIPGTFQILVVGQK